MPDLVDDLLEQLKVDQVQLGPQDHDKLRIILSRYNLVRPEISQVLAVRISTAIQQAVRAIPATRLEIRVALIHTLNELAFADLRSGTGFAVFTTQQGP